MIQCSACESQVLEVFEEQCEPCFVRLKITPLKSLREQMLKELSRVDGLLTAKLEKLARSSRHNLNLAFDCVCGSRFKTGLDLIAHLPDCDGPPKGETKRNGAHRAMMREDLGKVTEIG